MVCAARLCFWFLVGDYWILEGVFCLFSAGMHSGSLLAVASKVSAAAAAAAAALMYMDEQSGVCKGVSVYALQAKATARVDVPETSKTQGYGVEFEEQEK